LITYSEQKKVLVTGGTGFVGRRLLERLSEISGVKALSAVRALRNDFCRDSSNIAVVGEINSKTDWREALRDRQVVVHTAARVHIMNDMSSDPLAEFREVNVDGTLNLARQSAVAGVKRFIFISSIKVNGEGSRLARPYLADSQPAPVDPYGISKLEAEQGLRTLASETGMEVVIIRPTLVYGPGVKANFFNMMRWLHKGIPLPFGAICNRRSLVALDNLVDLIVTTINHPSAANQTFLVSDGDDLSTTELLIKMGVALGKPARLLPVPGGLLKTGAILLGKRALSQRLCGSLVVDISKTRELLSWTPSIGVDDALLMTAKHFLEQQYK